MLQNYSITKYLFLITVPVLLAVLLQYNKVVNFNEVVEKYFVKKPVENGDVKLFTAEELAKFNGEDADRLYLAILGNVYDVTTGKAHYEKGASYAYFVGKDASRSFISGDFSDDSRDRDHVLDLSCDELLGLVQWKATFRSKYTYKGKVIGRFYDEQGDPTLYSDEFVKRVKKCKLEREQKEEINIKYPPCNAEWNADDGGRVWCSKNSGGISRDWAGVPRHLYTPGEDKPRCACINLLADNSGALIKEYEGCTPASTSCYVKDN